MLLNPENTLFVRGITPVLLLAGAHVHDQLPLLAAPDGSVLRCEGWSIIPKLTLCVVDGPGDAGLLVPAMLAPVLAEDGGMAEWCGDVERAGGAVVLSLDELPEVLDWPHLLGAGVARGGFLGAVG
jgi:hypothetical protein